MKNILTIDFDIVMAPCIELYNNMVPDMDWDIMTDFPQGQLFNADLNLYQFLTNKLLYLLEKMNKEDIFVIEDHGQIIKYLDYAKLNTLEKLHFDLTIMLIVTFLSFFISCF